MHILRYPMCLTVADAEVKNKGWFSLTRRCRTLAENWTIAKEIIHFVVEEYQKDNPQINEQTSVTFLQVGSN